jgi:glycosyltransferase involved in cell wall biosynthesis
MFNKSISLVIPVFNEEEIIEETITIFTEKLSLLFNDFEIIVVNDGSFDRTAEILNHISAYNSKIRVLNNKKNIGSGISLWKGFQEAGKEFLVSNFADRPFDLNDLNRIMPLFDSEDLDFVAVIREDRGANTPFRKLTSWANFLLIRFLFRIEINDFQFVQVYRNSIIDGLTLISTGTFVPPELMIRLVSRGHTYKQISCKFYKRPEGKSKCGNPREYIKTFKEMLAFRFQFNLS